MGAGLAGHESPWTFERFASDESIFGRGSDRSAGRLRQGGARETDGIGSFRPVGSFPFGLKCDSGPPSQMGHEAVFEEQHPPLSQKPIER